MTNKPCHNLKQLDANEVASVSGGHPVIVAGLAVAGAYYTGKEIGIATRKAINWVKSKL